MKCVKNKLSGRITREADNKAHLLVSADTHYFVNKQAEQHYAVERLKVAKKAFLGYRIMAAKTK